MKTFLPSACLIATFGAISPVSAASFDIILSLIPENESVSNFATNPVGTTTTVAFTDRQEELLEAAAQFWESVITGFDGLAAPTLTVTSMIAPLDGLNNTLALAGPLVSGLNTSVNGFTYSDQAILQFDSNDYPPRGDQEFLDTAIHELGHTLGFGLLFELNGLTDASNTQYIGAGAVAAFNAENNLMGPDAVTSIQLTADGGHWDECYVEGLSDPSCSGTPGSANFFNSDELMTPFDAFGRASVSATTIAAFEDLGFVTAANANFVLPDADSIGAAPPVPLPAGLPLLIGALAGLGAMRRRAG